VLVIGITTRGRFVVVSSAQGSRVRVVRRRFRPAAGATVIALLTAGPAVAQEPSPAPWLKVANGVTQRVFPLSRAVERTVFVRTSLDTDRDGRKDRIRIRIRRPRGVRVPVIFEHSPYRGPPGPPVRFHDVDVDALPRAFTDSSLDDYYVPRGYAVVLGESLGTAGSDGCPDVGGRTEATATKAVIDWLNGRARGETRSGRRVRARWSTGNVGMIGSSYIGSLANLVATTGVEGLRTIVPIAAISSWYDYYRANGLVVSPHFSRGGAGPNPFLGEDTDVVARAIMGARATGRCARTIRFLRRAQDRATGDMNAFWRARDYVRRAGRVKASVFVVHGLNDFNVRTKEFAAWWSRLEVPRKLWLHNLGHETPGPAFQRTEHRWFDRWLFGLPNGIDTEPRATIQREDDSFHTEADWPAPGSEDGLLRLSPAGTLSATPPAPGPDQRFVDRGRKLDADRVLIRNPGRTHPNRLAYRSPSLPGPVRLSGTPRVDLRMSIDNRRAANLTAVLVDYRPGGRPVMVTRGWLDPRNRFGPDRKVTIRRGRKYQLQWDLQPDDHVFPAGHRIGLVVLSTDHDYTLRPRPGTRISLNPDASTLSLPVVGGAAAFGF
jgi:X-Pro dipeptidyl-peptidase